MNWLFELTKKYRNKKHLINVFAIVLYTNAHANIKKVLADHDYWNAIDEISGPRIAIFSIKPKQGKYEEPSHSEGTLELLIPIWKEPSENKKILESFELDSTKDLPSLIVFTFDHNNNILKQSLILNDSSIDEAYSSIKTRINLIAEAANKIDHENFKNSEDVFRAINFAIKDFKEWEMIKKGLSFHEWIKKILS